jgi:hypothetical protein
MGDSYGKGCKQLIRKKSPTWYALKGKSVSDRKWTLAVLHFAALAFNILPTRAHPIFANDTSNSTSS